jgi:hypothetical protein
MAWAAALLKALMRDGPFRIVHLRDGYCVCGHGRVIACDDRNEAQQTLAQLLAPSSTSGSPPGEQWNCATAGN